MRKFNVAVALNGPTGVPPATGINYSSWFLTGVIFRKWFKSVSPEARGTDWLGFPLDLFDLL